jgi:hypothetical protein
MNANAAVDPQPDGAADREVELVKRHFLNAARGDVHAAYEMLALNAVATERDYQGLIRRHVSAGYLRAEPPRAHGGRT